jgi:hypothetical protein
MTKGTEIFLAILLVPWQLVWRGWVLVRLWHWFVVPQFGLHELRIPFALGICGIVSFLVPIFNDKKEKWWEGFARSTALSGVTLLLGWIFQLFI